MSRWTVDALCEVGAVLYLPDSTRLAVGVVVPGYRCYLATIANDKYAACIDYFCSKRTLTMAANLG